MKLPSLRHFKFYSITMLILVSFSLLNAENYFVSYPSTSVRATMLSSGTKKEVILNSIDDTVINITYKKDNASVGLSLKDSNAKFRLYNADGMMRVRRLLGDNQNESALEQLRPIAYPLVPYLLAPYGMTDFHESVYLLARVLHHEKKYEELMSLMKRIPLKELSSGFYAKLIGMLKAQLDNDYVEEVKTILSKIEFENYPQQVPVMLDLLMSFLQAGEIALAVDLYQRVSDTESLDMYRDEVNLMLIYCQMLKGEVRSARTEINNVEFKKDDRLYSLYKMILGRIHLIEGDAKKSIMEVSQAIVSLDYSLRWTADVLYSIALAYDQLENEEAVKSISRELTLSFPGSKRIKDIKNILDKYSKS